MRVFDMLRVCTRICTLVVVCVLAPWWSVQSFRTTSFKPVRMRRAGQPPLAASRQREGTVEFDSGDCFYRPHSKIIRDMGVLALRVLPQQRLNGARARNHSGDGGGGAGELDGRGISVLDAMCGSGIRALRYIEEGGARCYHYAYVNVYVDLSGSVCLSLSFSLSFSVFLSLFHTLSLARSLSLSPLFPLSCARARSLSLSLSFFCSMCCVCACVRVFVYVRVYKYVTHEYYINIFSHTHEHTHTSTHTHTHTQKHTHRHTHTHHIQVRGGK